MQFNTKQYSAGILHFENNFTKRKNSHMSNILKVPVINH